MKNDDGTVSETAEWKRTAELTPEELLANFRNSYHPRIAVTVDMISTGTDVKPIECVFFLRNVRSAGFFEQMKGRGVRVISPDKLRSVTPSAKLRDLAGGKALPELTHALLQASDPDAQRDAAKAQFGTAEPTPKQIEMAAHQLARDAVTPFLKPALRRGILEIQRASEQTMDRHNIDEVRYSGFDAAALEKARAKVTDFQAWLRDHKDEVAAIGAIYAGTRPLKLTLADLRQLRDALAKPPLAATPTQLWRAFEATAPDRVQGKGGELLADLVNLVRSALFPKLTLVPYRDALFERYHQWLQDRDADTAFTPAQREWLDHIADHMANSLAIEPADFESGWFGQRGSLGRAHALFGDQLKPLLAELNERLAA